jgi:Ca-activated chloride channel family protein
VILSEWFLDPEWWPVLLLGPLSWFVLLRWDKKRAARLSQKIGPRTKDLVRGFDPRHRRDRRLLTAAAVFLAGLSLMRPTWGDSVRRFENRGSDLMVCLDVSRSMLARDIESDRISRAKLDITELVIALKNERIGLVVFAGGARLISPLTRDRAAFLELLDSVDFTSVQQGGTNLDKAVSLAAEALGDSDRETRAVFLLSDGEDQDEGAAETPLGLPVYAVGYGTALGGKIPLPTEQGEEFLSDSLGEEVVTVLNSAGLRRLATQSKGRYLDYKDRRQPLIDFLGRDVRPLSSADMLEKAKAGRENYFQWPLLLCFVLLVVELSWGDRRLK